MILQLLELPVALNALKGVKMELLDGAFPLLADVEVSSDANVAFGDADLVLCVGSKPRGPGMERADLIRENGPIFTGQGKAIDENAKTDVKVVVVGNPCNTNCLIAQAQAKRTNPRNYTAMTRLDQNRAASQLAVKSGHPVAVDSNLGIWGNHSPTMYPDFTNAKIAGRAPPMSLLTMTGSTVHSLRPSSNEDEPSSMLEVSRVRPQLHGQPFTTHAIGSSQPRQANGSLWL